jgi:hypothetical protein
MESGIGKVKSSGSNSTGVVTVIVLLLKRYTTGLISIVPLTYSYLYVAHNLGHTSG